MQYAQYIKGRKINFDTKHKGTRKRYRGKYLRFTDGDQIFTRLEPKGLSIQYTVAGRHETFSSICGRRG
jgi:hypothetical protein